MTRLFSRGVVRELAESGKSPLLARLMAKADLPSRLPSDATVSDAYAIAFSMLRQLGNRDDYVYRAAITQKIALGRHNLRTATVLNEVRASASKADLVILNGTSTAYEIKSERDSLSRLSGQLNDYLAIFASVYVVTSPRQADVVLRIAPAEVGVLALSDRFRLQELRPALDQPGRINPLALLSTLRVGEAVEILRRFGIEMPQLPNTKTWAALRDVFEELEPNALHAEFVRVVRESRSQRALIPVLEKVPASLRAALLAAGLSDSGNRNFSAATHVPLATAMSWST